MREHISHACDRLTRLSQGYLETHYSVLLNPSALERRLEAPGWTKYRLKVGAMKERKTIWAPLESC